MVKNHAWRIWTKALTQKERRAEADYNALIRILIVSFYIITCLLLQGY